MKIEAGKLSLDKRTDIGIYWAPDGAKKATILSSSSGRGTLNSKEYEEQREDNGEKSKEDQIFAGRKESRKKSKFRGSETKLKFSNLLDEEQDFLTKLANLDHFNFEPDFKVKWKTL